MGPDDLVLEIDPGRAFGSGSHPTTRLVLGAMEALVAPGDRVLDVAAVHARDDVQVFTFTGDFGPAPRVEVSFINDDGAGTPDTDRNLFLDGFTYNGAQHLGLKEIIGWNRTVEYVLDPAAVAARRAADFLARMDAGELV